MNRPVLTRDRSFCPASTASGGGQRLSEKAQAGGTLIVTLVMGLTVGAVLLAYLSLIGNRYELTVRSQYWNAAMPVLEAGIEEALTHLHDDAGDLSANGWTNGTLGGQAIYGKARRFSDGSSYYTVIYNAGYTNPYIYSTGFMPTPRHPGTSISRTAKVTGYNPPLLNASLAAIYSIQMNGNAMATDSFNSALTNLSNNGLYDPTKTSTNGNVASVYGPVSLGQHTIKGNLYLGPTVTPPSLSPTQLTGQLFTDFNVSYPDVVLPTTVWAPAVKTLVNSNLVYDFSVSGDYTVTDSSDVIVEPGVTVRLKVASTPYLPSSIHVMATNGVSGTLDIYQVTGIGTLNNVTLDSGRAKNLLYYGLPGVTSITYNGSTTFTGVIYAPEATLTLNGGGSGSGFIGACVVKNIAVNGIYAFHFDEDLLNEGPGRGLVVTSWQEL